MSKMSFKKLLTGVALLASFSAQAASDGFYVTGQLGYRTSQAPKEVRDALQNFQQYLDVFLESNIQLPRFNIRGLAGRVGVGYQVNESVALELGYLSLSKKEYSYTSPEFVDDINGNTTILSIKSAGKIDAIDLMLKAMLPLEQVASGFNLYSKLGVAYLKETYKDPEFLYADMTLGTVDGEVKKIKPWKKLAPAFGLGMSYEVAPNLPIELSWTRIQPMGGEKVNRPGPVDFFAVGIGYHFG